MLTASLLLLAAAAFAAPAATTTTTTLAQRQNATTPTVHLAGDSTMAEQGGKNGTEGWGHYLAYSLTLPVVNHAIAGRSARSFTDQGRFAAMAAQLRPGDVVVIEFGHNDVGGENLGMPNYTDNGRPACPGASAEATCASVVNGTAVVVRTFSWYVLQAARGFAARGARVVVSAMTVTEPWVDGVFEYAPPVFVGYAEGVAERLRREGVDAVFVNHNEYEAEAFRALGEEVVEGFFLMDNTHTQPEGADVAAKAFVKGVVCGGSALAGFVVNGTEEIPGVCL